VDRGVVVRGAPSAMELREMSRAYGTAEAEETAELLPQHDNASEYESYFIEYAMQKEMINRNRCPASRRLLSQAAHLDFNFPNSNHSKVGHSNWKRVSWNRDRPRFSFILGPSFKSQRSFSARNHPVNSVEHENFDFTNAH